MKLNWIDRVDNSRKDEEKHYCEAFVFGGYLQAKVYYNYLIDVPETPWIGVIQGHSASKPLSRSKTMEEAKLKLEEEVDEFAKSFYFLVFSK